MAFIGEIRIFAGPTPPPGWAFVDASVVGIVGNENLYTGLGDTYGQDGTGGTVKLPDLRSRVAIHGEPGSTPADANPGTMSGRESVPLPAGSVPLHAHSAVAHDVASNTSSPSGNVFARSSSGLGYSVVNPSSSLNPGSLRTAGNGDPHPNIQPSIALNFIICLVGIPPTPGTNTGGSFASLGGMIMFAAFVGSVPAKFALPNGASLSRSTFSGLFSLFGTTFGAVDGTHFNLPDLRGRAVCGAGTAQTTLSAAITSTGAVSISVVSSAGVVLGIVLTIDSEQMLVTGGIGTSTLTVTRGYNSTTAATHSNGATVKILSTYAMGQAFGEATHALISSEIPAHSHDFVAVSDAGNSSTPTDNFVASSSMFNTAPGTDSLSSAFVASVGSASVHLSHLNRQPYTAITTLVAADDFTPDSNVGDIVFGPWSSLSGFYPADGSYLDPAVFSDLFAVIGYLYGQSGSLFKIPDLRGRVVIGAGQGDGLSAYSLGDMAGTEKVVLSTGQMPMHTHPVQIYSLPSFGSNSPLLSGLGINANQYRSSGTPVTMHSSTIVATSPGVGHENRMPTMAFNAFIKK